MNECLTIGLTGGIGSGKSIISRILRCNGFIVYDCDTKARYLMENDPTVKINLIKELGSEIYNQRGKLNKQLLSEKIFSQNSTYRYYVNSVVHAAVKKDILKEKKILTDSFFIESAILVTGQLENICDFVWLIDAPEKVRIKRVIKRDDLTKEQIEKRIKIQKNELNQLNNEKIIKINNDGMEPVLPEVLKLINKYITNQTFIMSC